MLIKIVFISASNNRCSQRQLGFGTATYVYNFHSVNGLSACTANVGDAYAGLTKAAAGNGEVVGWRIIFTQGAVHHNLAAGRTGVVAVNRKIIANAIISRGEQQRAAVCYVAIHGIHPGPAQRCVTLNRIPRCQRTAGKNSNVVVHFTCGGKGRAVFNGNGGVTALDTKLRAAGDQRGAAVQNGIPCIAIIARQGQGVGVYFFDVTATGHIGGKREITALIKNDGTVISQSTAERCGFFAITQLQRGIFGNACITGVGYRTRKG